MVGEYDELHPVPVAPVYAGVWKTATRVEVDDVVSLCLRVPYDFSRRKAVAYGVEEHLCKPRLPMYVACADVASAQVSMRLGATCDLDLPVGTWGYDQQGQP